jgi:four helix bundle protein
MGNGNEGGPMPSRKGDDIARRLEVFAAAVLQSLPRLERFWASRHLARQLVRCATGGGSNYEEARGAESRADFVHKVSVAAKELREAHYWLRLARRAHYLDEEGRAEWLLRESAELVAILTASARTAKAANA